MDLAEQHRTFLFSHEIKDGNFSAPTNCRAAYRAEPINVISRDGSSEPGWDGGPLVLVGREEEMAPPPAYEDVPPGTFVIDLEAASRRAGPGPPIRADVLIYPDFQQATAASWNGQNFAAWSTSWEREFSPVASHQPAGKFTPVLNECGLVVGYYMKGASTKDLWVGAEGSLFYYRSFYGDLEDLPPYWEIGAKRLAGHNVYLTSADQVVAWTEAAHLLKPEELNKKYHRQISSHSKADILVDIDGYVLSIDMFDDPLTEYGLLGMVAMLIELSEEPPAECLKLSRLKSDGYCQARVLAYVLLLLSDIISLGQTRLARTALRIGKAVVSKAMKSAGKKGARALTLTSLALKGARRGHIAIQAPVDRMQALKRFGRPGYDERMGIPSEHLPAMVEAARETQVIAIFRANKKASIELIRQGAHGKPMWAKFKTSKETGVLTATTEAERRTAFQNGHFVVYKNQVERRMARHIDPKTGAVREIPLNGSWKVEKGQVVAPDGKPIVGDYDLLGVAPVKSPGSSIAAVPDDLAYGDWSGPVVKKYAAAVNKRFDRPRVLHGAQDQYAGNPKYMGLTDDTAYAVFPDGRVHVMEGKQAQKEFYDAMGRVAADGKYPRPAPGVEVVDQLAARRAKAKK